MKSRFVGSTVFLRLAGGEYSSEVFVQKIIMDMGCKFLICQYPSGDVEYIPADMITGISFKNQPEAKILRLVKNGRSKRKNLAASKAHANNDE
jgi:hypothetical protein